MKRNSRQNAPDIATLSDIATLLLAAAAYGAVISTGEFGLVHSLLVAAALLASWVWGGPRLAFPEKYFTALVPLVAAYAVFEVFVLSEKVDAEAFVKGVVYFLAYAQAIRIFTRRTHRDYLYIYALSFFLMCAAAILTISIVFLAALIVYLLLATAALILFTMTREEQAAGAVETTAPVTGSLGRPPVLRWRPAVGSFIGITSGITAGVLLLTFLFFFLLPRIGKGFIAWTTLGAPGVTGFSNTVQLGEVGRIKQDSTTVMRVRVENLPADSLPLYWRGVALDYYDHTTWTVRYPEPRALRRSSPTKFVVDKYPDDPHSLVRQDIYLEPIQNAVLFAAPRTVAFETASHQDHSVGVWFRSLAVYSTDYYNFPTPEGEPFYDRVHYYAYSDLSRPDDDALRAADAPPLEMARYLQLPRDIDPRIGALAREATEAYDSDYDKARALERYLDETYAYTLERDISFETTPLTDFLFGQRAGHCEYFATALAVMLRELDIPTRVVNGFQRGEYNRFEGYYQVRQSDAHSWVEAYFHPHGWVTLDATPAASIMWSDTETGWSLVRQYADSLLFKWNRWVVDYSLRDQSTAVRTTYTRSRSVRSRISEAFHRLRSGARFELPGEWVDVIWGAAIVLGLALLAWPLLHRYRRAASRAPDIPRRALSPAQQDAIAQYHVLLRKLARKGYGRDSAETPQEYAARVHAEFAGAPDDRGHDVDATLAELTTVFEEVVYGEREPDAEAVAALAHAVKKLTLPSRPSV